MKAVFSPRYTIDIGDHAFPTRKFQQAAETLIKEGVFSHDDLIEPREASREDLLLAHSADWVDRCLAGRLTLKEEVLLELPVSVEVARAHALSVSGTIAACRLALDVGLGLHIGGGSHHAMPDHGEGFCMFNDISCGILRMLAEARIRRAAVIDLDAHQGNGTAAIFAGRPDVFTFSIHQQDLYPPVKPPSTLDVGLEAGTGDAKYLKILEEALPKVLADPKPDLVVYQAGVDVYEHDLLGGLKLTAEAVGRRDRTVFEECFKRNIPVAVTLGGGYASRLEDTVRLHAQTLRLGVETRRA